MRVTPMPDTRSRVLQIEPHATQSPQDACRRRIPTYITATKALSAACSGNGKQHTTGHAPVLSTRSRAHASAVVVLQPAARPSRECYNRQRPRGSYDHQTVMIYCPRCRLAHCREQPQWIPQWRRGRTRPARSGRLGSRRSTTKQACCAAAGWRACQAARTWVSLLQRQQH